MNRWETLQRTPAPALAPAFGPLKGMRVLTTGGYLAMPRAAVMLGEFGAEVVYLELPGGGDNFRTFSPFIDDGNGKRVGSAWAGMRRNILSVGLQTNLRKYEKAREVFNCLIKNADVWIESVVWLEKLGLRDEDLLAVNPRLVIVHISGYGKKEFGGDPAVCDKAAFDISGQAASGWMIQNGEPDGVPMRGNPGLSDFTTGYTAVIGALMAYMNAQKTGKGQVVDVSMFESQALFIQDYVTAYTDAGVMKPRSGSRQFNFQPYDVFQAKDGKYVAIGGFGPAVFERIVKALDLDPEYFTRDTCGNGVAAVTSPKGQEFDAIIRKWVAGRTAQEVVAHMDRFRVAAQTVVDADDIVHDPHWIDRGDIVKYKDETLGRDITAVGVIPKLSETPGQIWRGAPTLGEDTDLVLKTLCGYTDGELAALRAENLIQ